MKPVLTWAQEGFRAGMRWSEQEPIADTIYPKVALKRGVSFSELYQQVYNIIDQCPDITANDWLFDSEGVYFTTQEQAVIFKLLKGDL